MQLDSCLAIGLAALAGLCVAGSAAADPIADFYRGRQVTIIVGGDAGTDYDFYARLLAHHLPRHLPGSPTFIFQYMPGAGSVIATNHVYNIAPQDGTVILAPARTATLAPIMGQTGTRYESARLNWLGSLNREVGVMQVWASWNVKTIEDARRQQLVIGSTSPLTDSDEYPNLLNATLGTRFKLVRGYRSITAIQLALEQGEVQGQQNSFTNMVDHFPDWRGKINLLVQLSPVSHPEIPEIPLIFDLIKPGAVAAGFTVAEVEELWRIILNQQAIGRPYAVGPEVPAERVAALRAAFEATLADPEFGAEAARSRLALAPESGVAIQAALARVAATPPATLARLRALVLGSAN